MKHKPHPISPRFRAAYLPIALAVFLNSAATLAAAPVRDELPAVAKKDWDAARELYDARDYRSALVHYQDAFNKSNNPRVLFNVGVCWKELTQYALAIQVWEKALTLRDKLGAEELKKFENAIAAARPFVSALRVETNEAGATLSIDGNEIGNSPFVEPVPINVGHRKLALSKPGFTTVEKNVDVVQGREAVLSLPMTPLLKTGTVNVQIANGHSATLFVDGRELGPTPFEGNVPEGPHTFEAQAAGYQSTRQTSEVVYGKSLKLLLNLAPLRVEGKLRVSTRPNDARISVDGTYRGTGAWEGLLPAGGHLLAVEKPDYERHTQEVTLSSGQERAVEVELSKQPAWVWWTIGIVGALGGGALAAVLVSQQSETHAVQGTLYTVKP